MGPVPFSESKLLRYNSGTRRVGFGKLQLVKPPVRAQLLHQLFMRANVADRAVFEHDDAIRPPHGREPVRNHKHSTPTHKILQRRLHQRLGLAVERRRRLIENQNRRIFQDRPCNRDALPLPARKPHPALPDYRVARE